MSALVCRLAVVRVNGCFSSRHREVHAGRTHISHHNVLASLFQAQGTTDKRMYSLEEEEKYG